MTIENKYYKKPRVITEPRWKSYVAETTIPIFTPERCQDIINLGRSMPPKMGSVGGKEGVVEDKRLSHISWIPFDSLPPMYYMIEDFMKKTNANHFGFEDMQLTELAQYTEYSNGGFYEWHMDNDIHFVTGESPVRKISMSLLLNHESEFEGGELELGEEDNVAKLRQGHAIFFASFLRHRVKPVTKGTRKSLVMWFGGTPFK